MTNVPVLPHPHRVRDAVRHVMLRLRDAMQQMETTVAKQCIHKAG